MGRYVTWNDVTARYPSLATKAAASEADSAWVVPAEYELDARLGSHYTVPFSSNNYTARDLSMDIVWLRINLGVVDLDSWRARQQAVDKRIDDLLNGYAVMMTTSGTEVQASVSKNDAYSTTENYHPTFGLGDQLDFHVSSARIADEEDWD